jgi:hypothetical protein
VPKWARNLANSSSGTSAGVLPAQAVQAAIHEFGEPGLVADGFLPEIAASHARRVATVLLVTGPLVGLLWIATAMASHLAIRIATFWQWTTLPAGLGAGIQLVAVRSPPRPARSASPLAARTRAYRGSSAIHRRPGGRGGRQAAGHARLPGRALVRR